VSVAEVVRLYGMRIWVEQCYEQVKHALGWSAYQVRSDPPSAATGSWRAARSRCAGGPTTLADRRAERTIGGRPTRRSGGKREKGDPQCAGRIRSGR
jgi:hypothetical protein